MRDLFSAPNVDMNQSGKMDPLPSDANLGDAVAFSEL